MAYRQSALSSFRKMGPKYAVIHAAGGWAPSIAISRLTVWTLTVIGKLTIFPEPSRCGLFRSKKSSGKRRWIEIRAKSGDVICRLRIRDRLAPQPD